MNRKTFLSTVTALIASPFLVKGKEENPVKTLHVKIQFDTSKLGLQIEQAQEKLKVLAESARRAGVSVEQLGINVKDAIKLIKCPQ